MWIRPKIEYEGDHQKIRVQVYPIFKNSKWEGSDPVSLSDDTKAGYKENKLFYALRFDKEGRNYMILVDKKNVKQIDKKTALEYLTKVANSLAAVEADGLKIALMVCRNSNKISTPFFVGIFIYLPDQSSTERTLTGLALEEHFYDFI